MGFFGELCLPADVIAPVAGVLLPPASKPCIRWCASTTRRVMASSQRERISYPIASAKRHGGPFAISSTMKGGSATARSSDKSAPTSTGEVTPTNHQPRQPRTAAPAIGQPLNALSLSTSLRGTGQVGHHKRGPILACKQRVRFT